MLEILNLLILQHEVFRSWLELCVLLIPGLTDNPIYSEIWILMFLFDFFSWFEKRTYHRVITQTHSNTSVHLVLIFDLQRHILQTIDSHLVLKVFLCLLFGLNLALFLENMFYRESFWPCGLNVLNRLVLRVLKEIEVYIRIFLKFVLLKVLMMLKCINYALLFTARNIQIFSF